MTKIIEWFLSLFVSKSEVELQDEPEVKKRTRNKRITKYQFDVILRMRRLYDANKAAGNEVGSIEDLYESIRAHLQADIQKGAMHNVWSGRTKRENCRGEG